MKPAHIYYSVLALIVGSAFVLMIVEGCKSGQLKQRYESTYKTDLAAISYVARTNYERVQVPDSPLKDLIRAAYPRLPQGFTARLIAESERTQAPWLKGADYVVEQNVPPYLVITSTGSLYHIPPQQPGSPVATPVEWNPHPGTTGAHAP